MCMDLGRSVKQKKKGKEESRKRDPIEWKCRERERERERIRKRQRGTAGASEGGTWCVVGRNGIGGIFHQKQVDVAFCVCLSVYLTVDDRIFPKRFLFLLRRQSARQTGDDGERNSSEKERNNQRNKTARSEGAKKQKEGPVAPVGQCKSKAAWRIIQASPIHTSK
mmetsp:Transcript_42037/g.82971  ORF Transcript_42037/g.82971 Transcript_42037/m.82971 type:complete len:166 (-) Transcript_42037:214-711(-)